MKKNILFILISFHAFLLNGQIPTINARGGESKVNWDYRFKMNKENEDEHPFVYGSGCTESPTKSYASSCLSQQGNSSYFSKNLIDWDPRTAWVEGKSDYGIGEYFEIDLPYGGSNIGIFNGYQKNHDAWMNNSRVKKLKVYGDGKPICFVVLSDKMGVQNFDLPANSDFNKYKFEIVEVYPGTKWKDVAISEICSYGCCFSASTFIKTDGVPMAASDLKVGSEIMTIDLTNNSCKSSQIMRTQSTHHNQMIRITAGQSIIELTSYHPLFFDGYGYTSLYEIKKTNFFNNYEEMTGTLKVLKWNDETKTSEYCTITNIEVLTGNFLTYSIEDLSHGETYIMNGFVSSTYKK